MIYVSVIHHRHNLYLINIEKLNQLSLSLSGGSTRNIGCLMFNIFPFGGWFFVFFFFFFRSSPFEKHTPKKKKKMEKKD